MRIRRKAIINKIMGEEAQKRGFTMDFLRKHSTFWPIVIFKRRDPYQIFEIREDFEVPGKISLMHIYHPDIDLFYNDEESFTEAIKQFEAKLEEDGYAILEERIKGPRLCKADYDAVYLRHEELLRNFCQKKDIQLEDMNFQEVIDVVDQEIIGLTGREWDGIKEDFYEVAAFYMHALLRIPDTIIYRFKELTVYVERTEGKRNQVTILQELFAALMKGNSRKIIARGFTDLLMAAELEENGFENPYKNM